MAERTRLDFTGPEIDDVLEGIESHVSFVIQQEIKSKYYIFG